MSSPTALIRLLTLCRREAGYSQREVAECMGTQQSAVSDLEAGDTNPTWSTISRYAKAVGAELDVTVRFAVTVPMGSTTAASAAEPKASTK